MLLLLSACALISKDDYDWRTNLGSADDSGGDSGEGPAGIEASGSLDIRTDCAPREPLDQVVVAVLQFELRLDAADDEPFVEIFELVDSTLVDDVDVGTARPYKLQLPALPPEDHHYEIEGVTGATYMVVAFVDEDGDGVPTTEDTLIGANSEDLLVYIVEGTNDELSEEPGWYLISVPMTGEGSGIQDIYPVDEDFFVWDVESNLVPSKNAAEALSGKVQADLPDGASMVTFWNFEFIEELFKGEATSRTPSYGAASVGSEGRFEFSPLGFPDRELLSTTGPEGGDYGQVGLMTGLFLGLAWQDDGDEILNYRTDERPYAYSSAAGADSVAFIWYEPIGFEAAFLLSDDVTAGWNAMGVYGDKEGEILPWSEAHLVLDDQGI